MKKILIAFTALLALAACNKSEDTVLLTVTPASLTFAPTGGTLSFNITSNGSWSIDKDTETWYRLSQAEGTGNAEIQVTVDAFEAKESRSAQFTVTAKGNVQQVAVVQLYPTPPEDKNVTVKAQAREYDLATLPAPQGYLYEVTLPAEADWVTVKEKGTDYITLHFAANTSDEYRSTSAVITSAGGEELQTVEITQSWRNVEPGELLIEEVFFTGNLIPGTDQSDASEGDQYFRLTNNSDRTVYADRVMVVLSELSSQKASTGAFWAFPVLTDSIGVNTVFAIPGNGTDVPVEPGASLILALAAQDFSHYEVTDEDEEGNEVVLTVNGFDLSGADFEFYDENESSVDTDNPDVPNLDNWFTFSNSFTVLHTRGFESYAIAVAPASVTKEIYINDYQWIGKKVMDWNGYHFERDITDAYLIPNAWVLDGVNCAIEENLGDLAFNASIDAGYTGCGNVDMDPDRYGKSVLRNRNAAGKLVDTNNSTNDFTRDAAPTLKK